MREKKEKRFVVMSEESPKGGMFANCVVLADRETGVNYLMVNFGQGAGVTPLLGREGKPIITTVYDEE